MSHCVGIISIPTAHSGVLAGLGLPEDGYALAQTMAALFVSRPSVPRRSFRSFVKLCQLADDMSRSRSARLSNSPT